MTNVIDLIYSDIYDGLPVPTIEALNTVPSWNVKHNKNIFYANVCWTRIFFSLLDDGADVIFSNVHLENRKEVNACLYHAQMMVMKTIYDINANDYLINLDN